MSSTDKQAAKELSIPAQLQAMRYLAEQRGWTIVGEFVEAGVSGRTADRPSLRQLLNRCRNHDLPQIDVVIVHKLDRLARNLADHVAIRGELRARGVTLASVTEGLEDSVSGQLVEHILASMAEFYSANLSEEVKKGMRQKVLQGGWPHQLPRGYRMAEFAERRRVAVDEVQGPLVRRAFEMCANDYRGLVDLRWRLASFGLRTKRGDPLSNGSLGRLLRNPFYCGRVRWNGQIYPGAQPALVEPEMFDRVQQILASRTKPVARNNTPFLLCGIAACATCGALMGSDQHRRWRYYRCRRSFRAFNRCKARYCNMDRVHDSLERVFRSVPISWQVVLDVLRLTVPDRERAKWLRLAAERADSAWTLFRVLSIQSQRTLLELLFERLEIDATGIVRFERRVQTPALAA